MSRIFLLWVLVAWLPGCALFQAEQQPSAEGSTGALHALKAWRMEGRIGVQTTEDAWQANLFWDHDANQDRLRVSGPLSQGMVSIVVQKDLIYVNEGNGITELSRDPDRMLRQRLGFAVPLASLRYWVLGIPDPQRPHTTVRGEKADPGGFQQLGWTVRVDRLMDVGMHRLPQKLIVQGAGVKLKIIGDIWEIKG